MNWNCPLITYAKSALFVAVLVFALAQSAWAEMGRAPTGPGGVYGGFTVGYVRSDEPETEINSSTSFPPSLTVVEIDPNGGLHGELHFGHVHSGEFLGLANFRFEGSLFATSSEDRDTTPNAFQATVSADGAFDTVFGAAGTIYVEQDSSVWGGTLAFKGELVEVDGFAVPVGLELFYVDSDDSIRYNIAIPGGPPQLFSDIEAEYYGVMGVIEPELRLSETIALVTRLAGGVYSYDFDGRFGGAGTATVSDSENGVGVRAEGLLGLKLFLSSAFSLTFFGGADYWSETPIANFPETLGTTAFIDRTHMVKLKAGITATVAFGGQ